jgi:hypothetical protein
VDNESSDSKKGFDEELGVPSIVILGVQKTNKTLKTNNTKVQKSTRVKYPIKRLKYDGVLANHYTYTWLGVIKM